MSPTVLGLQKLTSKIGCVQQNCNSQSSDKMCGENHPGRGHDNSLVPQS